MSDTINVNFKPLGANTNDLKFTSNPKSHFGQFDSIWVYFHIFPKHMNGYLPSTTILHLLLNHFQPKQMTQI